MSAFRFVDCFSHVLIIGGPTFSFLGLRHYRLKGAIRMGNPKINIPVNYIYFPHPDSKHVWCTSMEYITRIGLWAVAITAFLYGSPRYPLVV